MEELRKEIQEQGKGIGKDIVKVDMFLNHRIDTALLFAHALGDIPVVFAKKSNTAVLGSETVQAGVYSFTHKTQNTIRIERKYLPEGARVLIIDDFLADGQAVHGLLSLCEQQKATVVGVGIAVEKGFQHGGQDLRMEGIHLKSLAIVDGIEDGKIVLRPDDD